LDKRLAADGRGLQEVVINDSFAKFSEALMIAERHAREEVRQRSIMQQKISEKERSLKEDNLRQLAQKAREERAGIPRSSDPGTSRSGQNRDESSDDEAEKLKERENIRKDKMRQLQRDYRMSHMGSDAKARHARTMADRDISEKIALGAIKPSLSKDAMVDSRLYNQNEGLDSGFGADDSYNVYDERLFSGSHNPLSSAYRPKGNADDEIYGGSDANAMYDKLSKSDRFQSGHNKGFSGSSTAASRDGPVEFERAQPADVFGVDEFMSQARKSQNDSKESRSEHQSKRVRRE
jgi:SNW domain-containing protein 1